MHPLLEVAFNEYGVSGSSQRVTDYWKSIVDWATKNNFPWCGAFANWVLEKAGYQSPNSPNPQDFKTVGTALSAPETGCLAVMKGSPGHVTFVVTYRPAGGGLPAAVLVLGGNQDDQVKLWWRTLDNFVAWRRPVLA